MRIPSTHRPFALLPILLLCAAGLAVGPTTEEAIPLDAAAECALLHAAGEQFSLKRTTHFAIAYNAPTAVVVDNLLSRLEATYWSIFRFCERESISAWWPERRLEVIFFNTREEYERYAARIRFNPAGTYGVYFQPSNRSAFFNVESDAQVRELHASVLAARRNLDELTNAMKGIRDSRTIVEIEYADGRREQMTRRQADKQIAETRKSLQQTEGRRAAYVNSINRTVVQHETAHQVFYNAGVHAGGASNPTWLVEGLACLFETPPGRNGAGLGAVNQLRLQDFRDAVAGPKTSRRLGADDLLAAIASGRMTSPRDIILKPAFLKQASSERATNYAVTWALTVYLQRVHGGKLAGYLREVASERPGDEVTPEAELVLFEKHFGPIDVSFLKRFGGFVLGLPVTGVGGR